MDINAIETYLRMVGQELDAQGLTCEIILLGGAVMLIEVGNRSSTQDVDTYFVKDFTAIMKAAAAVARREGLPDGWLNSAAAGFTYNYRKQPARKLWKTFPGLRVYLPSLEYLLVTKLMAGRPKDELDIMALIERLCLKTEEETVKLMKEYVPDEELSDELLDQIRLFFA